MRLVIASGKGGTGKTTVATSLALSLAAQQAFEPSNGREPGLLFLDCDVEAPNAHLFLKPVFEQQRAAGLLIPEVNEGQCTFCGRCAEVCQFHAMAVIGQKLLLFPELCHGCGSCSLTCPEQAISEKPRVMGVLEAGPAAAGIYLAQGTLNIGEPMAVPLIRQLKQWQHSPPDGHPWGSAHIPVDWPTVILDAPPGTSCPVVETMRGADFALLVTEPTPFGLHDLRLMVEVVRELNLPAGVIINRDGVGEAAVDQFCVEVGLPVLMRIPLEREIGEGLARGEPLVTIRPDYAVRFRELYQHIQAMASEVAR